jgi:alpha-L-fucosidase
VIVNDRWGKECRHKHGGYFTTEYGAGLKDDSHPWEESRGMGHSYGYNRAESIDDYKPARELILTLIDLVSRGGNFLLDIGPTGDGRIPVIMQQRLLEIGDWLRVNGEAIYGTRFAGRDCQWSDGKRPGQEYGEYMVKYNLMEQIGHQPKNGVAVKQVFFTRKPDALYAITPGWPGCRQHRVRGRPCPENYRPPRYPRQ